MLGKNTQASVATVAVALIAGVMVALLLTLMPAPAQAQSGDELRLLSLKVEDITNDEGPFDYSDEPYIKVDGATVWSIGANNSMKNGDIVDLAGVSKTLDRANAQVQVWERDPGLTQGGDDLIGEFNAAYTDGTEQTQTLNYRNGEAVYVITYEVDRPEPSTSPTPPPQCSDGKDNDGDGKIDYGTGPNNDPGCESATDTDETDKPSSGPISGNTAPTIDPLKPAPGSKIHNSSPLIAAKVSDAETDLAQGDIKLFVDGKPVTNFSYDVATDQLSYRSGKLAYGGHTVKVEATDASALMGENTWKFKVVKR
jgi:hypothetical protein